MFPVQSAYEQPHSFIPERWYSQPHLIKDRRAFSPFGIGKCETLFIVNTGPEHKLTIIVQGERAVWENN
jgi:hypothetical protein